MTLRNQIRIFSILIFVQVFVVYFLSENTDTWAEEWVLLVRLIVLGLTYALVDTQLFQPLEQIKKVAESVLKNEELPTYRGRNAILKKVYEAFAYSSESVKNATIFIQDIGQGNLESVYPKQDKLGDALVNMRNHIRTLAQKDAQRQWLNEGLAKFVEVMRDNNNDLNALCDNILTLLVRYMNVQQGGIFLLDDSQQMLNLVAAYAYDERRIANKKIGIGEGLLGQVVKERTMRLLHNVPANYSAIESGLGVAQPNFLLIISLKTNKEVLGAIELCAWSAFEPHHIELVEKLSESIAATIANTKSYERTERLLQEAQMYTEQMRAQEEELKQNIEELQATQEAMRRDKEQEIKTLKQL